MKLTWNRLFTLLSWGFVASSAYYFATDADSISRGFRLVIGAFNALAAANGIKTWRADGERA